MGKENKTPVYGWTKSEQLAIIRKIWPNLPEQFFNEDDYRMFLEYVAFETATLERFQDAFAIRSLDETLALLPDLKSVSSMSKDDALRFVKQRFRSGSADDDDAVFRSIDLAIRLWLPLEIRSSNYRQFGRIVVLVTPHVSRVDWKGNVSLKELVQNHFVKPESDQSTSRTRIDPAFTMAYLVSVYGIRVYWTHNLADHLAIDWRNKVVTVYEHKICLFNHLHYAGESVLPKKVLEEALDTLNLLFPFLDGPTSEFLSRQGKPFDSLGYCNRPRLLEMDKYVYWRDKIEDLIDLFNEPPRGLRQLKLDRTGRNLMQFSMFWIAAIVAVLTVFSIVFGSVQTVYAIKQYKLAIAQACSVPGAASQLPQFC
jgi:hypothetical protein